MIYHCLKFKVAEEVDSFWDGYDRFKSKSDRNIDIDNLQGITIYLVWAAQRPELIVDLFLVSEFISETTKKSTRIMYLDVLKASIDYLLEANLDDPKQSNSILSPRVLNNPSDQKDIGF